MAPRVPPCAGTLDWSLRRLAANPTDETALAAARTAGNQWITITPAKFTIEAEAAADRTRVSSNVLSLVARLVSRRRPPRPGAAKQLGVTVQGAQIIIARHTAPLPLHSEQR